MERSGDRSQPAVSLHNALKIQAQLEIQFTQICMSVFMGTRSPAAVHNPTAAPYDTLCTGFGFG
jgi:hypothetical protein